MGRDRCTAAPSPRPPTRPSLLDPGLALSLDLARRRRARIR
jgi:hypothetical protein